MTIVFGQALNGDNIIFGQLDESLIVTFSHSGVDSVALADNGTHELIPVHEHGLGITYDVYLSGIHEFVQAPAAPNYLHSGSNVLSVFDAGTHEHLPVVVVFDHPGVDTVTYEFAGGHVHFPGAAGDFIHSGTDSVGFPFRGTHAFIPPTGVLTSQFNLTVTEWLGNDPSQNEIDFSSLSEIELVNFSMVSDDPFWVGNAGPQGGEVSAVIELVEADGTIHSVASLSAAFNQVTLFDGSYERFDEIAAALEGGPVNVRIGGYESFAEYSIPLALSGSSAISAQALQ